jgi:hypothetical protein
MTRPAAGFPLTITLAELIYGNPHRRCCLRAEMKRAVAIYSTYRAAELAATAIPNHLGS